MSEVTFYEYDLETIKEGFNKWLDKWKESVIDEDSMILMNEERSKR